MIKDDQWWLMMEWPLVEKLLSWKLTAWPYQKGIPIGNRSSNPYLGGSLYVSHESKLRGRCCVLGPLVVKFRGIGPTRASTFFLHGQELKDIARFVKPALRKLASARARKWKKNVKDVVARLAAHPRLRLLAFNMFMLLQKTPSDKCRGLWQCREPGTTAFAALRRAGSCIISNFVRC